MGVQGAAPAAIWRAALLARPRHARLPPTFVCACAGRPASSRHRASWTAAACSSAASSLRASQSRAYASSAAGSSPQQQQQHPDPQLREEVDLQALEDSLRALDAESSASQVPDGAAASSYASAAPDGKDDSAALHMQPTLRDLKKMQPSLQLPRMFHKQTEEEQIRILEKRYHDAVRKLSRSFTLAQLRSLAKEAGLADITYRSTKAAIVQRIVSEVWKLPDPNDLEQERLAKVEAEKSKREPLEMTLSSMAWVLLNTDSVQRRSIARKHGAEITMLDAEQGTVSISGPARSKESTKEALLGFVKSLRTISLSLPAQQDASLSAQADLPAHVAKMLLTSTHCLALNLDSDEAAEEARQEQFALIGPSEEACTYAGAMLRSWWTARAVHGKDGLFVYSAQDNGRSDHSAGSSRMDSLLYGRPARPLTYHHSPQVLPSTRSWLSNALTGAPDSTTSQGLALTDMKATPTSVTRIVRSTLEDDSRELYLQRIEPEARVLRAVADLGASTAPDLWATGSIEPLMHPTRTTYTAKLGAVTFPVPATAGSWHLPRAAALADALQDGGGAVATTSRFLPTLPPADLFSRQLGDSGLLSLTDSALTTESEDVLLLTYASEEGGVRLELELVQEAPETESMDSTEQRSMSALDRLLNFDKPRSTPAPEPQREEWRVKEAKLVQSQVAHVLVPDGTVDLRCDRHVERSIEISAEQLEEIRQYLPASLPSSVDASRPPLAAPDTDAAGVFVPPAALVLPSTGGADGEAVQMHLLSYSRVLRRVRPIELEREQETAAAEVEDARIDPREAGYLPMPAVPSETTAAEAGAEAEQAVAPLQHDCYLIHEEIADPGERITRREVYLRWVPRKGIEDPVQAPLPWPHMQKALQPWLESRHKSLWNARRQRLI